MTVKILSGQGNKNITVCQLPGIGGHATQYTLRGAATNSAAGCLEQVVGIPAQQSIQGTDLIIEKNSLLSQYLIVLVPFAGN